MMQFMPGTTAIRRQTWNWPDFDPFNPQHAIHGAARELSEIYGRMYGNQAGGNWAPVVAGYNWGDVPRPGNNRDRLRNWGPETQQWLRDNNVETSNYWQALMRGYVPPPQDTTWGFPADGAPPSPSGPFIFQNGQWVQGRDDWWNGDTGVEVGAGGEPVPPLPPGTTWGFPSDFVPPPREPNWGFTAPLPFGRTGLEGQSLQNWINNPAGGQQVAGLSEQGGYTLPEGVVDFVGRVAPELGGGPQAFPEGNFPWFTPGRISGEEGAILQHHALMPNNLVFDPEALTWRVPDPQRGDPQRFPGATGIWGAQTVADWLPGAATGFGRDYLTHLGYGAEHNAGGLSNTYYGAPNLYGAPNIGRARQLFRPVAAASARSAWATRALATSPTCRPTGISRSTIRSTLARLVVNLSISRNINRTSINPLAHLLQVSVNRHMICT